MRAPVSFGRDPALGQPCLCAVSLQGGVSGLAGGVCATLSQASTATSGPDCQNNVILPRSLPKHKTNSDYQWTTNIYI